MGFLRRDEPLHEKLAREGGLDFRGARAISRDPLDPDHPL